MSEGGVPLRLPAIHLNDIALDVREDADGTKALVMGPIALILPLDDEGVEWLQEKLRDGKVQVVPASALTALPKPPTS